MTTKVLAGEYLQVKGTMWSSKGVLEIIRGKALANSALPKSDSEQPSVIESSFKGEP